MAYRTRTKHGLDLTAVSDGNFTNRFWSKVDRTSRCWLWTAHRQRAGYGQFTLRKGVFVGAHRVSFALAHGAIPPGRSVCHHCDNPPCVNPDHLFLGSQRDNAMDMFAKGRATRTRGTDRFNAVLDEAAVRHIRAAEGYRGVLRDLSAEYGVSGTTIRKIRLGLKWRHVA